MVSYNLKGDDRAFPDWKAVEVVIYTCLPSENMSPWTIASRRFFLQHLDILKILEVLILVVFFFHVGIDFFPNLGFDFRMPCDLIDHHLGKVGSGICPSHEECIKLLEYLFFFFDHLLTGVTVTGVSSFHDDGFYDIRGNFLLLVFLKFGINFGYSSFNEINTPFSISLHSFFDVSLRLRNSQSHKFRSQQKVEGI